MPQAVAVAQPGCPSPPPPCCEHDRSGGVRARVLAAAALAACLAGCVTAGQPSIPASLLTCADAPTWRKGDTQRDVAGYVTDQLDAHADCKDKLDAVRSIVEPAE